MSGTSIDAVDAVLAYVDSTGQPTFCDATTVALPPSLQSELLALNQAGTNELVRAATAAQGLVKAYAQAVTHLLNKTKHTAADITAIGAH